VPVGDALVTAMAFFVWYRTRFSHFPARLNTNRERYHSSPRAPFCVCVSGLSKIEAEDLLDWLDATGHHRRKLDFNKKEGFSVFYS
jgi:hypothetical protein